MQESGHVVGKAAGTVAVVVAAAIVVTLGVRRAGLALGCARFAISGRRWSAGVLVALILTRLSVTRLLDAGLIGPGLLLSRLIVSRLLLSWLVLSWKFLSWLIWAIRAGCPFGTVLTVVTLRTILALRTILTGATIATLGAGLFRAGTTVALRVAAARSDALRSAVGWWPITLGGRRCDVGLGLKACRISRLSALAGV